MSSGRYAQAVLETDRGDVAGEAMYRAAAEAAAELDCSYELVESEPLELQTKKKAWSSKVVDPRALASRDAAPEGA